jgi:hypothetical protein
MQHGSANLSAYRLKIAQYLVGSTIIWTINTSKLVSETTRLFHSYKFMEILEVNMERKKNNTSIYGNIKYLGTHPI